MSASRLRRFFDPSSRTDAEVSDLQADSAAAGAVLISSCERGEKVTACGVIRSVVIRPRAGSPALEAELFDGSGSLHIVWLGRRRIQGVEVGRSMKVEGRMTCENDEATLFNPRYWLRPRGDS